jgi:hypothetical protein
MRIAFHAMVARSPRKTVFLLSLMAFGSCDSGVTGPGKVTVGVKGGTISLAERTLTLSIPADALSSEVEFTATESSSFPASDLIVPGTIYDIGPSQTSFRRLARLTLSYDPENLPEGVREVELRLFQVVGNHWEQVLNTSVDVDANTVTGLVSTLGQFGAKGVPVASVVVSPLSYTLENGGTRAFSAGGVDEDGHSLPGRAVTWTSSDEGVATVDSLGLVTARGIGAATITATAEGGSAQAQINTWDCSWQTEIPTVECRALIDFFNTANTEDWRMSQDWVPTPLPCAWRRVTCSEGSVSELDMRGLDLPGAIPFSIGDFANLERLDLTLNDLTGTIPSSLGNLSKLSWLDFSGNQLSGSIPSELGQLANLTSMDLSSNDISGPIPPGLGALSSLTELNLGWNALSGSIPPELGTMASLTTMSLIDNALSGSIPPELGDLSKLTSLSIAFNQLSGRIPPELGKLSNLTSFGISNNQLTGAIPAEVGNLTKLEWLMANENDLSGPIPLAVAQLGGRIQARSGGSSKCIFTPPGNTGLSIPEAQEYRDADLNGDGKICGVTIGG